MLHDESGRFFRARDQRSRDLRGASIREPARILIVDPVVGSRFALAKVVAQPGVLAETAASAGEARRRLERGGVALVLADDDLGGGVRGIDFLIEVRASDPTVRRALVVPEAGRTPSRAELERAELAFLLAKPWDPIALRSAIRETLGDELAFVGWEHRIPGASEEREESPRAAVGPDPDRRRDLLARGLLAGLNACESESEVVELLHAELAGPFAVVRWLWLDEERAAASRIAGDWPLETGIRFEDLESEERAAIERARRSSRITRLDGRTTAERGDRSACIGFGLKHGGRRVVSALVFGDPQRSGGLLDLLRDVQPGLEAAIRRIRDAEARALAARRLAQRVSEELRTPVGALSHAIDRLRGEAMRAGMSTEWVDRVSSESQRLARAVEHFEDSIVSESEERIVAPH